MLQTRSAAGALARSAAGAHILTVKYNNIRNQKNIRFLFKKKRFVFVFVFFSNFITECPSPQARGTYYAADAERRRRVDPSRKKLVARAKRGSRALTRRGE